MAKLQELEFDIREPQCEGCGERPEVYGSSWCASCHRSIPEYTKRRILTLRNAMIMIRFHEKTRPGIRDMAIKALEKPRPARFSDSTTG